jgi:ABC-type nitrate/sulfonate/bicarbonate transport system permease component
MLGSADGRDASAAGFLVGRQAAEPWNGPTPGAIARSLANVHEQTIAPAGWKVAPALQRYGGPRGRRRGDRAVVGIVLGALGGLVAGGVIGSELSTTDSCHCSDPQLHGFLIGGSIGAVVGGFLGYALAR